MLEEVKSKEFAPRSNLIKDLIILLDAGIWAEKINSGNASKK